MVYWWIRFHKNHGSSFVDADSPYRSCVWRYFWHDIDDGYQWRMLWWNWTGVQSNCSNGLWPLLVFHQEYLEGLSSSIMKNCLLNQLIITEFRQSEVWIQMMMRWCEILSSLLNGVWKQSKPDTKKNGELLLQMILNVNCIEGTIKMFFLPLWNKSNTKLKQIRIY